MGGPRRPPVNNTASWSRLMRGSVGVSACICARKLFWFILFFSNLFHGICYVRWGLSYRARPPCMLFCRQTTVATCYATEPDHWGSMLRSQTTDDTRYVRYVVDATEHHMARDPHVLMRSFFYYRKADMCQPPFTPPSPLPRLTVTRLTRPGFQEKKSLVCLIKSNSQCKQVIF